jgi:pilus assembly protein CpaE
MMPTVSALVALDDGAERETAAAWLSSAGDIRIVGFVEQLEDGLGPAIETPADVMVVVCGGYSDQALYFIDGAVRQQPERPVVVLCSGSPNGFVRRVFEVGAEDMVIVPDTHSPAAAEQIRFMLQKTLARRNGGSASQPMASGELICVLGPKGGTGKTLTSSNLTVSLAGAGESAVVVDLDLQFGDIGLALGLDPDRTIYDLATSSGSLDDEKLDAYLATHRSGARALLSPVRPDQASAIKVDFLREVFTMLRSAFDYVIVDTPPGFTPEVIASIDSSSYTCMVCTLDALSLKNTRLGLETLALMGYDPERTRLILNRADSKVGLTEEDVVAIAGREPDVRVPSHRDIARSMSDGTPIALNGRGSDGAQAYRALAESFIRARNGEITTDEAPPKRRMLRRRG